MDTFPPPAPVAAPPLLSLQPQSAPIPTMNTNFSIPSIVNPIPMDVDPIAQNNNINHSAANPTPSPAAGLTPSPNHPPYAEMISSAIEALKEKDGSSKRAIAKYIEQSYSGLPSTHSGLLSHHLKRLKNSGHLVMVKKSYKIPKPGSVPVITQTQALPNSGTPRGRGRPPKPKPDSIAQPGVQPIGQPFPQPPVQFIGQTNVPTAAQINGQTAAAQPNIQANPQPVLVALGLVDEPNSSASAKKRPGRPRKIMAVGGVSQGAPGFAKRGRGRPPGSKGKLVGTRLSKKSPGRPRKPKSVLGPLGPKRGPGRPSKAEPKTMVIPYATNVPIVGVVDQSSIPGVIAMPPKPRGRPKKVAGSAGTATGVGILSGKRRGRPPKVAGVNIFKTSTARGRPKKSTQPSTAASDALIAANGELKRKLEYFQSKVKQAVGMLRPELTHESSVTAIAAVQELEELATMDLNAPLREEVQHPVVQT